MEQKVTINKMGTEKIQKIMLSMGIPMILSMVLQACYNIVDSMFVARIPDTGGLIYAGDSTILGMGNTYLTICTLACFGVLYDIWCEYYFWNGIDSSANSIWYFL